MTQVTKRVIKGVPNMEAWNRQRILTHSINIVFVTNLLNRSPQHKTAEHLNTYILIIEMTLWNILVNTRHLQDKQMWWKDQNHVLWGMQGVMQMPPALPRKHFKLFTQPSQEDSHILNRIWFYLIPVNFNLIHFNQCSLMQQIVTMKKHT